MVINDEERACRKISQIGYYRLSGYWHPFRVSKTNDVGKQVVDPKTKIPIRRNTFVEGTNFDDIIKLYLFDKKLRLLILDAIERIEVHIRSIMAHELGKFDPIAYRNTDFIHPNSLKFYWRDGSCKNNWIEWVKTNERRVSGSKDICIKWHKDHYQEIPFWVIIETWDFGLMSNYYNILGDKYKEIICKRIKVPNKKTLNGWLKEINFIRNKCAHHSRLWNMRLNNPLSVKALKGDRYFRSVALDTAYEQKRIFCIICILWFLVKQIGPGSTWIKKVADHIDTLPICNGVNLYAMGITKDDRFPRKKFDI